MKVKMKRMDAVEFFKTANRLCKNRSCRECPVCKDGVCMVMHAFRKDDNDDLVKSIEETVSKVEQWAKEHPIKTRQSEFLKMFPKAEIKNDYLWICPKYLDCDYRPEENCYKISCGDCKREFWLTEVTDND